MSRTGETWRAQDLLCLGLSGGGNRASMVGTTERRGKVVNCGSAEERAPEGPGWAERAGLGMRLVLEVLAPFPTGANAPDAAWTPRAKRSSKRSRQEFTAIVGTWHAVSLGRRQRLPTRRAGREGAPGGASRSGSRSRTVENG